MFQKFTIGTWLGVLAAGLILLTCLVAGVGYFSMHQIRGNIYTLSDDAMPGLEYIGRLTDGMQSFRASVWRHIAASDKKEMRQLEQQQEELKLSVAKAFRDYREAIFQEDDRKNCDELESLWKQFIDGWENKVRPLSRRGTENEKTHNLALTYAEPVAAKMIDVSNRMVEWNSAYGKNAAASARAAANRSQTVSLMLALIAIFGGGGLAVLLLRNITAALRGAVQGMSASAEQVASVAGQVSASSQALAEGSSEQAASLEETSASGEEINAMARQNTEKTHSAAHLVAESQKKFVETNESLDHMLASMNDIKEQSGKISKIIKVIDEIAFQTNILALNAAVEAARAGEAGMGFAVVADEVRSLAQRCAQAAKDTASMIEESIAKANEGNLRVDHVAVAIRGITEEAASIRTLIDEVNIGSQEQARGIDEIGRAITQVDQVTQRNAATAEECAAAAQELNAQSVTMRQVVENLTALVG